jgi:hypothetical protein
MGENFGETLYDYFYDKKKHSKHVYQELRAKFDKGVEDVLPDERYLE